MTTLVINDSLGPGTHVFIIGVGKYPYLVDGTLALSPSAHGMGQLTSPPISARKFLQTIELELTNSVAPLKTIEVLISEATPTPYTLKNGQAVSVDPATMQNVEAAAAAWYGRLSGSSENVGIFYFCGHGIGDGVDQQLLLEDFGRSLVAINGSIDFQKFRLGMGQCGALQQCFFVDACRTVNPMLLLNAGTRGNPLLPLNVTKVFSGSNPVFYSTRNGESSFAMPNAASYFTDALLSGLTRFGARKTKNKSWSVSTGNLLCAMEALLARAPANKRQACTVDSFVTSLVIHELTGHPEVLIDITLSEPAANGMGTLS